MEDTTGDLHSVLTLFTPFVSVSYVSVSGRHLPVVWQVRLTMVCSPYVPRGIPYRPLIKRVDTPPISHSNLGALSFPFLMFLYPRRTSFDSSLLFRYPFGPSVSFTQCVRLKRWCLNPKVIPAQHRTGTRPFQASPVSLHSALFSRR